MIRACAPLMLLLASCGGDPFQEARDVLSRCPQGADIRWLERRLSLPAPSKTLAGSALYQGRIFEYHRKDGLFVRVGLIQTSEVGDYPQGRFVTRGHYGVRYEHRDWMQWEWDDHLGLGKDDP